MPMKNTSRLWNQAAAFVTGGCLFINSFDLRAQTADSFDPQLSYIAPGPSRLPPDVKGLAVQPDGRFLIGGKFNDINGIVRFELARFQPGGALETAFRPSTRGPVKQVGVLRDGRIFGGLENDPVNPLSGPFFIRYLPGGATDTSFSIEPGSVNGGPWTWLIEPDGSLIPAIPAAPNAVLKR